MSRETLDGLLANVIGLLVVISLTCIFLSMVDLQPLPVAYIGGPIAGILATALAWLRQKLQGRGAP